MKKILHLFKKIFSKKTYRRKCYLCDPARNSKCSKDGCWYISKGPCRCTYKRKCAQIGEDGKPVIATDNDMYNLEWLEYRLFGKPSEESQKKQGL